MKRYSKSGSRIPSILSIPEKIEVVREKLLALRLPLVRVFSLSEFALIMLAVAVMLLGLTAWLSSVRTLIMVIAALLALLPQAFHVFHSLRRRMFPIQEVVTVILTVMLLLGGETLAAVVIPVSAELLYLAESYAMLHREAEIERFETLEKEQRPIIPDEERTKPGRVLATSALVYLTICLLLAIIFLLIALFHREEAAVFLRRSELFLLLSIPSAAICSFKMCHFGVFSSASRECTRFKNDQIPALFAMCSIFAFSKTGTITEGKYRIGDICPVGISAEELLRIAAVAECRSEHPIAQAIRNAAGLRDDAKLNGLQETKEYPGKGVSTFFAGKHIYVGNGDFLDEHGIWYQVPAQSGSAIHVAIDNVYRGYLMVSDSVRENAFEALEELRSQKVSTLVMLTGDVRSSARTLASALNFDLVKSGLQSSEKGAAVEYLRDSQGSQTAVACVGDGIHDSAMFQSADIAVCFDTKRNNDADINIFSEDIMKLPIIYRFCKKSVLMSRIAVFTIIGMKFLLCFLGLFTNLALPIISLIDVFTGVGMMFYSLTGLRMDIR